MEFDDENDAALLVYMRTDDPQARAAWGAFYKRHAPEVYRRLRHRFREQLGEQGVEDLHTLTFQRAFEKADTFEAKSDDREVQAKQVVAWLCKFALNLFLNLLRKQANVPTVPIPDDVPAPQIDGDPISDEWLEAAREVLDNELDDRERTVLFETATWMNTVTGESNMSRGVAKKLADRLGTSVANVRQVRRRALAKFEKSVIKRIEERTAS